VVLALFLIPSVVKLCDRKSGYCFPLSSETVDERV
jgi:hypothetical protein